MTQTSTSYRPTYAEVDLGAIRHNIRALTDFLAPTVERLAVVKANAYGHGDVEVARACLEAGATRLGVALVEEGVRLRDAGIDAPIQVLVEATPEAAKEIVARDLTPSVFTYAAAQSLNEAAAVASKRLPVHVCVDTGMHREGAPFESGLRLVEDVARLDSLELEGLWSHFALGEQEAHPFTAHQIELFSDLCSSVEHRGIDIRLRHLTSSAGIVLFPDSHFDLVRMGIMIYGLHPHPTIASRVDLRPALRLVSSIGSLRRVAAGEGVSYGLTYAPDKDSTIVTVLIGYGDGYSRLLSNRGSVLIDGRRHRVAGRVTMDQTLVDCGDADVAVGDEVVLIGRQGAEEITADELADQIGTINYEVVTAVGARVPRTYVP